MNGTVLVRFWLLVASLVVLAGCGVNRQTADRAEVVQRGQPVAPVELAGTAWRLVEIVSMDDHVYAPEDRALYTLEFNAGGSVRVRADCNFATGFWVSGAAGQLQFGQLAATRASCVSDSLHDRFMAQFPWVRSYVMKAGHLFLATMADASIVEFEPMPGR